MRMQKSTTKAEKGIHKNILKLGMVISIIFMSAILRFGEAGVGYMAGTKGMVVGGGWQVAYGTHI